MANCPYCGSDHFAGEYLQLQVGIPQMQDEIGYNRCTECGGWSKYVDTFDGTPDQQAIADPQTRPTV